MTLTPAQILATLPITDDDDTFGSRVAQLVEGIDVKVVDGTIDIGAIISPVFAVAAVAVHQLAAATGRTVEQTIWELRDALTPDEPPC